MMSNVFKDVFTVLLSILVGSLKVEVRGDWRLLIQNPDNPTGCDWATAATVMGVS